MRPQAAGAASGMTGFTQMAIGAASTQLVSILLAGATTAMPMAWMMLVVVVATGVAFWRAGAAATAAHQSFSHSSSLSTLTPCFLASFSFEPAPGPATT